MGGWEGDLRPVQDGQFPKLFSALGRGVWHYCYESLSERD